MNWAQAIVLGIVQGLTEFLPVSSTVHLALAPKLLGWPEQGLFYDVMLHWGTLVAVCVYLRRDLVDLGRGVWSVVTRRASSPEEAAIADSRARLAAMVLFATVPAAVAGALLKAELERLLRHGWFLGLALVLTAAALFLGQGLAGRWKARGPVTWGKALVIGLAQVLALFPKLSRSGATISAALAAGVEPGEAARFSFLLSIPAILGAGVLEGMYALAGNVPAGEVGFSLVGAAVAAVSGYVALRLVFGAVQAGKLHWFGVYCAVVGLAVLLAGAVGWLPA